MPPILRRPRPRRDYLSRSLFSGFAALMLVAATPVKGFDRPPPTFADFRGKTVVVAGHATVERVLRIEKVVPKTGRLLSMKGSVLDPSAHPPSIMVNGNPASVDTRVRSWEDIEVVDGADSVEPTVTETIDRPEANPQFYVGNGTVTVRRGLVSGEVEVLSSTPGTGPPEVALTFDDGPNPTYTPQILDLLAANQIKATFYVLGNQAKRHSGLVRREVEAGMVIGNHSWDHAALKGRPVSFITDQMTRTKDALAALGVSPATFRPPYGSFDSTTVSIASSMGMRTVIWSTDTFDWRKPGVPTIVERVLSAVRPGSVILMHDGGGDRSQTVEALKILIPELKARGYTFVTV